MEKSVERIVRVLTYIAAGTLFLIMVLITVDVTGRYLFNRPLRGAMEMSEFGLAIVVLLGLAYTALLKGHIGIEPIVSKLSARGQAIVEVVNSLLGIAVFSLIAWQGLDNALHRMAYMDSSDILHIPTYPFRLFVPLGAVLLCLVLINHILQSCSRIGKRVE